MKNFNLILVDDLFEVQECNTEILQDLGHNVICNCANGKEAVEAFRIYHNIIDIMVLDFDLPYLNGKQVYEIIKTEIEPGFNNVIFFTSYSSREFEKELNEGCFHVEKPAMIDTLLPFFDEMSKRKRPKLTEEILSKELLDLTNQREDFAKHNLETRIDTGAFIMNQLSNRIKQIETTLKSHRLNQTGLRTLVKEELHESN